MYNEKQDQHTEDPNFESLKVRNSRKVYLPLYLMVLVLVSAVVLANLVGREVDSLAFGAVLIFSVIILGFAEIHRYSNFYEITQNSLIISQGIITNSLRKIDLFSVSDVDSSQNIWHRLLGYGDVKIRLYSGESSLYVRGINNPVNFVNFLINVIDTKRGGSKNGN